MADKMNVFEAQKWAFSFADDHGMERSTIDMLICGQMDWDVTHLLMHYRDEFSKEDFEIFRQNVEKCAQGMPPQYVLSKAVFFKRTFLVNESTLIPRVETEDLVEWILHDNPGAHAEFLDIGTGSGAIGLTLKAEKPFWKGMLSDVSSEALRVARKNAKRLKLKAEFKLSDVFDAIEGKFDIIVSNPPYIAESEKKYMDKSVLEHEPALALFAENNGLAIYQKICRQLKDHLKKMAAYILRLDFYKAKPWLKCLKRLIRKQKLRLKKTKADMIGWSEFVFEFGKGKRC